MKKARVIVSIILTLLGCLQINAQVLFSIGNNEVRKDEFISAFSKNNNNGNPTESTIREYLELYIRFKLKVRAAYDAGLDTLPVQQSEFQSFRNQVAEGYLHNENTLNNLVNEALLRSRKDIHIAHIYIAFETSGTGSMATPDTLKAFKLTNRAYKALLSGTPFDEAATLYSSDKSASINRGDLGYITVFTLPYELENLVYATPVGKFTAPHRSKLGYHIFKNLGERKAAGKMQAAQILFAFPPGANEETKAAIQKRADSVYLSLLKGASFSKMVTLFSGDNSSLSTNGIMPEIGVGEYEPGFEKEVFSLKEDGTISKPFLSTFGYHIVKRLSHIPVYTEQANDSMVSAFKQLVSNDTRMEVARKEILKSIKRLTGFKAAQVAAGDLQSYTDSSLLNLKPKSRSRITAGTLLFSFPKQRILVSDWIRFLKEEKPAQYLNSTSFAGLFEEYQSVVTNRYYLRYLETYNAGFAAQMKEFREGNMLFEVMQRNIWDKAASDTMGLKNYYESNKDKYFWEPGVDAIVFACTDSITAIALSAKLAGKVNDWRLTASSYQDKVQADSGRFEIAQLPVSPEVVLTPGMLTSPRQTRDEPVTFSFAYIVKNYPKKAARNFDEAKGFVINDYQAHLEENWIKSLKQRYPVSVNTDVLRSLWK